MAEQTQALLFASIAFDGEGWVRPDRWQAAAHAVHGIAERRHTPTTDTLYFYDGSLLRMVKQSPHSATACPASAQRCHHWRWQGKAGADA
jgi:hypothetical protein